MSVASNAAVSYELVNGAVKHALAIHSVCHAAMSGDTVSKVLQAERTFESGSEEPSERRDERSESSENKAMQLEPRIRNGWYRTFQAEL